MATAPDSSNRRTGFSCSHPYLRIAQFVSCIAAIPLSITHDVLSHGFRLTIPLPQMTWVALGAREMLWSTNSADENDANEDLGPIFVLLLHLIATTTLIFVLSDTWIGCKHFTPQLAMLGAYATVPLLIHSAVHLFFAFEAIWHGLGVRNWVPSVASPNDPNEDPQDATRLPVNED